MKRVLTLCALAFALTPAFADEGGGPAPELSDIKIPPHRSAARQRAAVPWNLADLKLPEAWARSKGDARVCVVDTGVDALHPRLSRRISQGYSALAGSADYADHDGQGTAVAGIIAAVAPDVRLYAAKVAESPDTLSPAAVAAGIVWCAEQRVAVINVGLTLSAAPGQETASAVEKAVKLASAQGALIVTAAAPGNALAKYKDVVAVAPSDFRGRLADGDSEARASFVAPGLGVAAAHAGGRDAARSGPELAAAHVSGLAALYAALHPRASPRDIRAALAGAVSRSWLPEAEPRAGKIDAARLVHDR